jgi:DNA-binding HxlR family transcriptional regulator
MMLRNSVIRDEKRLKALPSLQRWGLIIVEFKAENKGRMRTHQHLFMLEDTVKDLEADGLLLKAAISKVPIADWIALLEDGWGAIKETRFGMAYGDKKLYIPYRILSP